MSEEPMAERTGVPLVDSILESVDAADSLPLADQVAVFERAQEQLRRALDAPTEPVGDPADESV